MAVAIKNSNTAFLPGRTNSKEDKIRSAEQSTAKRVGRASFPSDGNNSRIAVIMTIGMAMPILCLL
jgi:hypothetical protein